MASSQGAQATVLPASILLLDENGRANSAAINAANASAHAVIPAVDLVDEKIPRREFYRPLVNATHFQLGEDHGKHCVGVINLCAHDFVDGRVATHFRQLKKGKLRLLEVLVNVAAYYAGIKPWRIQGEPDRSSRGFILSESLLSTDGVVVGLRVFVGYERPLTDALFDTMEENATTARNKSAGTAATAVRRKRGGGAKKAANAEEDEDDEDAMVVAEHEEQEEAEPEREAPPRAAKGKKGTANASTKKKKKRTLSEATVFGGAAPAGPAKAAKRARHEREPSSVGDMLEEMRLAADPWRAHGPLVAGFRLHSLEAEYILALYNALTDAEVRKIFGKGRPKTFHSSYLYLRTQRPRALFHDCILPYYERDADAVPSDKRGIKTLARNAYLPDDEEALPIIAKLFTMGDAFIYNVPLNVDPAFIDPYTYFGDRVELAGVRREQPLSAASLDDFARQMQEHAPFLMQAGAPFPTAFPRADLCVLFDREISLPEILPDRPLPFPIGIAPEPSDLSDSIDALVERNKSLFARLMVEVRNYEGRVAPDEERALTRDVIVRNYLVPDPNAPGADGEARALMQTYEAEAQAEHERRVQRRVADELQHPERIREYVVRRQRTFRMAIGTLFLRIASGRYPRLLSHVDSVVAHAGDATAAERQRMDREVLIVHRATTDADGEEGGDDARDFRTRLLEQNPSLPPDLPIYENIGDEGAAAGAGSGEGASPLLQAALRYKGEAGYASQIPDAALATSDLLMLRVIHSAEQAKLRQEWKSQPALTADDQDAQLRALMDRQMQRTHELFMRTENESEALLRCRKSAQMVFASDRRPIGPIQPCINGRHFDAAMTWADNTITVAGRVAPRTRWAVLLTYFNTYDHLRTPEFGSGDLHTNSLMAGANSTGKSFTLGQVIYWHLEGTVERNTRITPQAMMDGKNNSNRVIVSDEVDPSMIKDPSDRESAMRNPHDKSGNSQAASFFKQQITEGIAEIVVLERDPETGQRYGRKYVSLASNLFHLALNWDVADISAPMRSRFTIIEFAGNALPGDDIGSQYRPRSLETTAELHEVKRLHDLMHAMIMMVEVHLTANSIPGGVISDMSGLAIERVMEILKKDFYYASETLSQRKKQFIATTARILCIYSAVWALLFTEVGHGYLNSTGHQPYDWQTIRDFIVPQLKIAPEHVFFSLSLYAPQFRSPYENDIMMIVANDLAVDRPLMRKSLRTMLSDLAGDTMTQVALGIRETPSEGLPVPAPVPAAGSAPPRTAAATGGGPVPPTGSAPPITTVAAAAGGGGAPARPAGAVPPPPRSLLAAMMGGRGGSGGGGAAPPVDFTIDDERYLTCVINSLDEYAVKLTDLVNDQLGYKIRPEFVRGMLRGYQRTNIPSYYYRRDPLTSQLEVLVDSEGVARQDPIPVVIVRDVPGEALKKKRQIGFAIAYFNRVHYFNVAIGDAQRIEDALSAHMLRPSERDLLRRQMAQTPLQRLKPPMIEEEMVDANFARAWARAPILSEPVLMAILRVMENGAFRRTRPISQLTDTTVRSVRASSDDEDVRDTFIVMFSPKSFTLACTINGRREEVRINLSMFLGLIDVRRNSNNPVPSFANMARAKYTGRRHLAASLGLANAWDGLAAQSKYLTYNETLASYLSMDPDAIDSIVREQKSGSPQHRFMNRIAQWAGCDLNVPWSYGPNMDKMYVALYTQRARQDRLERPDSYAGLTDDDPRLCIQGILQYPEQDILLEVREARTILEETRTGRYRAVRPITDLLIDSRRWGTAPTDPASTAAPDATVNPAQAVAAREENAIARTSGALSRVLDTIAPGPGEGARGTLLVGSLDAILRQHSTSGDGDEEDEEEEVDDAMDLEDDA